MILDIIVIHICVYVPYIKVVLYFISILKEKCVEFSFFIIFFFFALYLEMKCKKIWFPYVTTTTSKKYV